MQMCTSTAPIGMRQRFGVTTDMGGGILHRRSGRLDTMNGRKTAELRSASSMVAGTTAPPYGFDSYWSVEMRKSSTVLALAAGAILTWAPAGYAQAPQPDPKSANYQAKGEQEKSYIFPGTTESI